MPSIWDKMTEDAVSNDLMQAIKKQRVGGGERVIFYTLFLLNVRKNLKDLVRYCKRLENNARWM